MQIGGVDVVSTAKKTFADFRKDDLQGLAAEVTYHFLFAFVPLVIFLTAMSGFVSRAVGVDDAMGSITDWLFENLPDDAAVALEGPIRDTITNQAGAFLSVGAVLALWGGKNAMAALMKALNTAFGVEDKRPWWKKQAVAVGLTVALGLAITGASSFFLAGSFVGDEIADVLGVGDTWTAIWSYLRWPLIGAVIVAALAFLYWAGPDVDAPLKWLTPGSVLAVVLWVVATFGLTVYFAYFGPSAETYGVLGGVLAFVYWVYVMSLILLLGGELNSVLAVDQSAAVRAEVAAKDGTDPDRAPDRPVVPFPVLGPVETWPSAEQAAKLNRRSQGAAGETRREKAASRTLAASLAAAAAAAVVPLVRRVTGRRK